MILTGFYLFHRQSLNSNPGQVPQNTAALDLGIVYLPVTPKIADYYELGVDSGALLTEVVKGSLVDRAGIRAGDVIISFNGIRIGEATPLLGMIRACPVGENITLEFWSDDCCRNATIVRSQQ